jgi:hypothetical protein
MAEHLWSVVFVIGDDERVPIEWAGTRIVGPDSYMVVYPGGEDGPSTLYLDARGKDPRVAEECAREIYRRIRAEAELSADEAPQVVTVMEVVRGHTDADRFMFAADEMWDQKRFGLAVVAAQIHCELRIGRAVRRVARDKGEALADLIDGLGFSWSLMGGHASRVFEELFGVRPSEAPCWDKYQAHVARRNGVVHRGESVSEELARESIDAAHDMADYVEQRAIAVVGHSPP